MKLPVKEFGYRVMLLICFTDFTAGVLLIMKVKWRGT
jgi:hypothetical protein